MRVACVQFDCRFAKPQENLAAALALMENEQADLYILPELFHSGYLFIEEQELHELAETVPDGMTVQALEDFAHKKRCGIVAGIAEKSGEHFYNSAVFVDETGFRGLYRKIHLYDRETLWFTPGEAPFEIWPFRDFNLGIMICFDWIFPESMRSLALLGADLVCHPSNLVLPYCQNAMVTRCLENRVFAATANRTGRDDRGELALDFTGQSQITGPDGSIILRAGKEQPSLLISDLPLEKARNKQINEYNHLFTDRRPDYYHLD